MTAPDDRLLAPPSIGDNRGMRRWLFAGAALLAAACTPVVTTSTNAPTTPSGDPVREEAIEDLEPVLRRDPALAPFLDDAVRRRIQILVAVPRDDGEPGLRRLGFRVDAEYFYPASAVKLAIATAALQKLDEASATPKTPLRVVEREGAQTRTIVHDGRAGIDHAPERIVERGEHPLRRRRVARDAAGRERRQ